MKIQAMSVLVGGTACNASCPFCISKQTPTCDMEERHLRNSRNLLNACLLAERSGCVTALLTGKGELTLYHKQLFQVLSVVNGRFPFIELQTNGISLAQDWDDEDLKILYLNGVTTVSVSMAHYNRAFNKKIYSPNKEYIDHIQLFKRLNCVGFTIRISCMAMKNGICNPDEIQKMIEFCRQNRVKQLTIRPINYSGESDSAKWTQENTLTQEELENINDWIVNNCTPILRLAHGDTVYDYKGQNVCWASCLTTNKDDEEIRQIIVFPDGTIRFDWKYEGAVLL